jgi:hypothetical protein
MGTIAVLNITFTGDASSATVRGTLNDSPSARAVAGALPIESQAGRWGEEIYFRIPAKADLEPGATDLRAVGDLAYWPPGPSFCIFFGRTLSSTGPEPRASSPVNLVGRLEMDAATLAVLKQVRPGDAVRVTAAANDQPD